MKKVLKKTAVLLLAIMLCVPTVSRAEGTEVFESIELQEDEALEFEVTEYEPLDLELSSRSISLRGSAILSETSWGFNKNACTLIYTFLRSTSGSVTITLQKENSDGSWSDVASKYHSFSYTSTTSTSVPVSNLSAGTYQIKTEIYAVVNSTLYEETKYTGTRRLY